MTDPVSKSEKQNTPLWQGGFSQPRRTGQQHMIQGLFSPPGRLDGNQYLVLDLLLADEFFDPGRPQCLLKQGFLLLRFRRN